MPVRVQGLGIQDRRKGEILSVLSDEQHVVPPLIEMAADWSPESILPPVSMETNVEREMDTGLRVGF